MLLALYCLHALFILAPSHASVVLPRNGPSVTVPLHRRSPAGKSPAEFAAMADSLRNKYNVAPRSLERRQSSSAVPVSDENSDSSYSGSVTIGGQNFEVILDTGSSDLWVASTQCTQGCDSVSAIYNPSSSSNFKTSDQQVSITYGSGAVSGIIATDAVTMGGFSINSQTFVIAEQVTSGLLDTTLSGLIGLGFKSIANTGATPLVEALASSNAFSLPLMSFYFERHITDQNPVAKTSGGVLTLGATNSSLFTGSIDFVNIPSTVTPGFWLLPVTGVSVDGSVISQGSTTQLAAIDTGTTLIGGPTNAVASLYSKIPGSQPGTGSLAGYYTFPCSTTVSVSFSFGGNKSWPINPVDFKLETQSGRSIVCIGAVFDLNAGSNTSPGSTPPKKRQSSQSTSPDWIVGDSFLKNVYSVFQYDPPSVGFAQLSSSVPGAGSPPGTAISGGSTAAVAASTGGTSTSSTFANPSSSSVSSGTTSSNGGDPMRPLSLALVFGLAAAAAAGVGAGAGALGIL